MELSPELLKKVKLLEIQTRKLVNSLFAGEYHSAFKGQGMTFSDFREYVPGDDVRHISWTLTARADKPYIKKYDEERELTLMIAVDVSGSGEFGSKYYLKKDVIAQLAALLSFSAVKNNDRIGLLLFSDTVEHYVPPKKGRGHVHRILRDILFFEPRSKKTKISEAMEHLRAVLNKKTNIFIFSDFIDTNYERSLRFLGKKHDTVAVVVEDQFENELPSMGLVEMQDSETDQIIAVDTSSPLFKKHYKEKSIESKKLRDQELRKSGVGKIVVQTNNDFVDPLISYFKMRSRK
ncbi:MAG: DUF58 domain-containing protein [Bdellovibrionota bacterium]